MRSITCCFVATLAMLSFGAFAATTKEDTPGTPEYFSTYIDGRYGYTNGVMYKFRARVAAGLSRLGQRQGPTMVEPAVIQLTGVVLQIIDTKRLLFGIKRSLKDVLGEETTSPEMAYQTPAILLVDDISKYVEGETVGCWVVERERYTCKTAEGKTLVWPAYSTPVPHAITFDQYAALVQANAPTPDRLPKIISCESRAALIEYDFSVTNGQATITRFNTDYVGALDITNSLGGCPVTEIAPSAFARCYALTSVTIPSGVTKVRERSFSYCNSLTNVTLPSTVEEIHSLAFSGCGNLSPASQAAIESKTRTRQTSLRAPLSSYKERRAAPPPGMAAREQQQREALPKLAREAAQKEIQRREQEAANAPLEPKP